LAHLRPWKPTRAGSHWMPGPWMCIYSKGARRACGVSFVRIGVWHKSNSHFPWGSLPLCTTCASGVKRCWGRSLSYSSHKTLESNKSDGCFCTIEPPAMTAGVAPCLHLLHTPSLWQGIAAPGGYILLGSARVSTGEERETRRQEGSGAPWGVGGHIRTSGRGTSIACELQRACVRSCASAPAGARSTHQRWARPARRDRSRATHRARWDTAARGAPEGSAGPGGWQAWRVPPPPG